MEDEKKMKDKPNKAFYPASNKTPPPAPPQMDPATNSGAGEHNLERGVRIKMRPGRAAEGVAVDENGYATVDAKTADHLVKINYAEYAK